MEREQKWMLDTKNILKWKINMSQKTGLLAFSKANSIQYHFIEVMRCIFLVFKNSSQKPLKDKLQILHLNFKFKVTFQKHCTKNICLFVKF